MKFRRVIFLLLVLNFIYLGSENKAIALEKIQLNMHSELICRNTVEKLLLAKKGKEICCDKNGCWVCGTRGDTDISIISPPGGKLLDRKPNFSWSTVPNIKTYIVRLEDSRGILWEREVTDNQLTYPENEAPLKPGKYYDLKITADNLQGKRISSGKTSFRMLSQAKVQELQTKVQSIYNRNQTSGRTTLEIAKLYFDEDLITEAIKILEKAANNKSKNIEIYLKLGNLYRLKVRNNNKAEENYQKALDLAKVAKNRNAQAEAEKELGEIDLIRGNINKAINLLKSAYANYEILSVPKGYSEVAMSLGGTYKILEQKEEAISWYQKAKNGYEKLNDKKRVKWIDKQISELMN